MTVTPEKFFGYTGTWYLLNEPGTHPVGSTGDSAIVFNVQDPSLDIRIWDYNRETAVNDKTVPHGTRLMFRVDTNMYGAADATYRSPLNPATDGFINITVKNETGVQFSLLYNDSTSAGAVAGPYSLLNNYVNEQPFYWGSPGTYSWKTDARNGGSYLYPAGTYTVSAESSLNHMRDNYRQGSADYTGKTVSRAYTVTLAEGLLPAPVANFTADITSGEKPLTVTFQDTSNGTRKGWNWTFGDGNTVNTTNENPVHTYTAPGTYDVTLRVDNGTMGSDTITKTGYITVTSTIEQGDTIFIGEEKLNVTHALNQAYYCSTLTGSGPGGIGTPAENNSYPLRTAIGWWGPADNPYASSPSKTIDLGVNRRYASMSVSTMEFSGYNGTWYLLNDAGARPIGTSGETARVFNVEEPLPPAFEPMPGMVGVFRPSATQFILLNGTEKIRVTWGKSTDAPVAGDWNGDGIDEIGVHRAPLQKFLLKNGTETTIVKWGTATDTGVAGDWNGDGMGDIGVFRSSLQKFILKNGTEKTIVKWGLSTDLPVTGDWNGDGMDDIGVFRPSTRQFVLKNGTEKTTITWGQSTDLPVAADWNGDGMDDVGVFRPAKTKFVIMNGTQTTTVTFGLTTDLPVAGRWR